LAAGSEKSWFTKELRMRLKGMLCYASILTLLFLAAILLPGKDVKREITDAERLETNEQVTFLEQAESVDEICVLLKTSDYEGIFHDVLEVWGEDDLIISHGSAGKPNECIIDAGELFSLKASDEEFWQEGETVTIRCATAAGKIAAVSIQRSQGVPRYSGILRVTRTSEGLIVVNRTGLEEYLCGVVPSEMPASYPAEALKAQAICARTYALEKMKRPAYPAFGAHLDDSTAYQVYQNVESREETNAAVRETAGLALCEVSGELAETYYYSTSCGHGTDEGAWNPGRETVKTSYLNAKKISKASMERMLDGGTETTLSQDASFLLETDDGDYEFGEPWYRWTYEVEEIDPEALATRIRECLETKDEIHFDKIHNIEVTGRSAGGVAVELRIEAEQGDYCLQGERLIRQALCDGKSMVRNQAGQEVAFEKLLPSAFILLNVKMRDGWVCGYEIIGGGYGHGIGMSQNAAKNMALEGRSAEEILQFFYKGLKVRRRNGGEHAEENASGDS